MIRPLARAAALALCLTASPIALAAAQAQAVQVPPIQYQERTLANGMKVFTSRDVSTPNVTVQVFYDVGSKDDPAGRSGFAHLFEHMMFKSTRNTPSETLDRMTEDVGGFNNASTWDDYTNYYEVVPAEHLQRILWLEAERMGALVVDEATFKSERDVVKEELRQSVLSNPYGRLFYLYLPQASYAVHPYKRPGIGSIEELDAATIDDVRAFHAAYYRPDNAALFVVGNFDETELNAWVDRYFGRLAAPKAPIQRVTVKEPPRTAPSTFTGYGPNVPLPAVVITWLAPDARSPDAAALTVLDAILVAGKNSRLYNSLVYDKQVATQVLADASLPAQPGIVYAGAIMASGHTVEEGEAALLAEVKKLRDDPPSEAELAEAKNELIAAALRGRETVDGRADALGVSWVLTGDAAGANKELAELQAVTGADVQRVAAKYYTDAGRKVIRYLPESARPAGEKDALPPPPKVASVKFTGEVVSLLPEGQREAPPAVGEPLPAVLPNPAEKTLPNGLRVIVARSSDLPLVGASLLVKTGAWADPEGKAGAAAMTAGMLTEGTASRSAVEIAAQTEALGATLGSGAGLEASSLGLSVMPDKLDAAMAIMADVARNPAFKPQELERQRQQALDGLQVAYESPGTLASMAVQPLLFGGSPFGHTAGGTPATLKALDPATLKALHQTWYRPDNAVLVLTGDIDAAAGFAAAEKAFGDWARPATALPTPPAAKAAAGTRAVVIDVPGTGQAAVSVVGPAIARSDARYYPAIVANNVLGGGYSARLNQEIRIKRGLSYGARAFLDTQRTAGAFRAVAQTKNESAPEVLGLIRAEMTKLGAEPVAPAELKARQSVLIGGYGRALGTASGLAGILGELALYGVDLGEVALYTQKVQAVQAGDVQAYARTALDPRAASVLIAGDAKVFTTGLKATAPDLEVIPADQLDLTKGSLKTTP